jgi:lipid II:glycine glycyltransferase (peptidoglycan interpeptide bridge formation enzyme)
MFGYAFYAPRGPVAGLDDTTALYALLAGIREHLVEPNGIFARFDPYWERSHCALFTDPAAPTRVVPRDWSSWNAPRFVFWLDVHGTEDDMMRKLSSTCRNEVRKGYKNNVEFSLGHAGDLNEFHRLMTITGGHKGIAFRDASYYRDLIDALNRSATAQLFVGKFEGSMITTGMSIRYGHKAWLMYAASDPAHYKLRANRTLQWEMIKWALATGCTRYDFRGTATNDPPTPNDPGLGVYEFKKSFGPEFTRLSGYHDLVARAFRHRVLRYAEDRLLPYVYRARTWIQRDS